MMHRDGLIFGATSAAMCLKAFPFDGLHCWYFQSQSGILNLVRPNSPDQPIAQKAPTASLIPEFQSIVYERSKGVIPMPMNGVLLMPPLDRFNGASLFLDFDGTIVELARTPDAVVVSDRVRSLLSRLVRYLDGRVAIVSGRDASEVRRLIGLPQISIAGSHGIDLHMADGRLIGPQRPEALDSAIAELQSFASSRPGLLVEIKTFGCALHYRQCPDAELVCREVAGMLAERHGLHLQTGKMVVELRGAEGDKGSAVRQLMAEPDMLDTRPIFIGDDDTDEPAFLAAKTLGGAGVLVGAPRQSEALYRLPSVSDTLDWLERSSL
jgi:trehalose 6-phosphate phosphatase